MTRTLHTCIFVLLMILVLASCSENESEEMNTEELDEEVEMEEPEKADEAEEKEDEYEPLMEAPTPPATAEGIIAQPIGELAGMNHKEDLEMFVDRLLELPSLENADEEVLDLYWNTVYHLFAEEFPSPQDLIDSWKTVSFGSPEMEDLRYQFKEQFNVEIILDASGSMAGFIGNQSKMDIAKESILEFTASLPEDAQIGLRVYGHEGTGDFSDRELSCKSTELIYDISSLEEGAFHEALNRFNPAGWTPIGLALDEAAQDLSKFPGEENTNIIFLVSDGIGTCDDEPIEAAKRLAESNIQPIVNVIGFDVDAEGQNQLKELAGAANGSYSNVNSRAELQNELDKAKEMAKRWEEWKTSASYEANHIHHTQFFDALAFSNDWGQTNIKQSNNIWYTLIALKDQGYMSQQAFNYLDQKRRKHFDFVVQEGKKIYADLQEVNADNLQEMLQEIEDKYSSQG